MASLTTLVFDINACKVSNTRGRPGIKHEIRLFSLLKINNICFLKEWLRTAIKIKMLHEGKKMNVFTT